MTDAERTRAYHESQRTGATIADGIEHAFAVGSKVIVLEARNMRDGEIWKEAIVQQLRPYRGQPGYYVSYPGATQMYECHSGWKPEHLVRAREPRP